MKPLQPLLFLIILLVFSSCSYIDYAENIKKENKAIFNKRKDFVYKLNLSGRIIEKKECEKCTINKYTLTLFVNKLDTIPSFRNRQYPPYYSFSLKDSTLIIAVNKTMFEKASLGGLVIKQENSNIVNIDNFNFQYLDTVNTKWLPD